MIPYEGWNREYQENRDKYIELFDRFMSQSSYENAEFFENSIAEYTGRKYAVSVASATDALYFSLLAHGVGPGDEVLVTDFSWISTSSCISMVGATPVFCDIDIDSYHISIDSIKRMYSPRVKALIYTHLFGNMTDTAEIEQFCKQNNIALIEDAAQSLGSSLDGRKAGTIGDSSSFSFNTNKVIAGINGGGVYLTDDETNAEYVKKLRRHGKDKDFELLGYNSRMYTLNAEIIHLRMQSMLENQNKRQDIAETYRLHFEQLPVIVQQPHKKLVHNFHKYVIRLDSNKTRNNIRQSLNGSVHYETPLSKNTMYNTIKHRRDSCINADKVSSTVISLPIHAWLQNEEIKTVTDAVKLNII